MRIEANTLPEAFSKAASELSCSVTELDYEIIQHPSGGLFGFFKKNAIIDAYKEGTKPKSARKQKRQAKVQCQMDEVLGEIKQGVQTLVEQSCFDIELKKLEKFNDETILVELNGEDAALLIGKEGYRYKAFSYLLYNWINIKYGFGVRLEIAEFLQNQEAMIEKYLAPVIERIENNGRGQTKPLDGVLIKIALERLRNRFPEKYVGIKTGREGAKFIVVNDFTRK